MVSLFTAIPVDKACYYLKKKLEDDSSPHSRTKLDIEDHISSLLNFVLSNNCFMFDDKIYRQIHSCTMGSPVSPVVANLCMEEIEEWSAISASAVAPKVWKCYVDDSFCTIKKDEIPAFHNILNSLDPHISFTIEYENGQIPFLDTLVSRHNDTIYVNEIKTHRQILKF